MRLILSIFLLLPFSTVSCSSGGNNTFDSGNIHFIEVSHYPLFIPRTMTVTVADHEKKPLPDAEVTVTGTDGGFFAAAMNPPLKLEGQTDQDGKIVFQFPDEWFEGKITHVWLSVNSSRYTHSRSAGWYESQHPRPGTPIVVSEEVPIAFDGDIIAIQVLDEAVQPVAGTKIHQGSITSPAYPQVSDAQGMLYFGPLQQWGTSGQTIRLLHPDFQNQNVTITQADTNHLPKIVTLQSGSEIFGSVIDEQGQPVTGASVFAIGEKSVTEQETVTDEKGHYHLKGLYPSDQFLIIAKEGKRLHLQTLNRDDLVRENNVTLQKAVPIRIRVVTEDGQPLHGVKIEPKDTYEFGKFRYEYPKENILLRGGVSLSDKTHFTDENGFWEWPNVPAGVDQEIEFQLEPRRALPSTPKGMTHCISPPIRRFQPQEEPYIVTATLQKDVWSRMNVDFPTWKDSKMLKVRVLDENLKPMAGALVEPCSGYGDSYGHHIHVEEPFPTDENGIVCFDFSRTDVSDIQDFWIKVTAEGYRTTEFFHTIGMVTTAHARTSFKTLRDETEVILSPEGKLVGLVKDENGKPVEGATVTVTQNYYRRSAPPVVSDKNGKWIADITQLPLKDSMEVNAKKDGYLNAMIWLRGFQNVTMQTAKSFSIRVVDDKGNALEGVQITSIQSSIQPLDSPPARQTNARGEIRVGIVPKEQSNTAEILLQKDGWTPQWVIVDVTGKQDHLLWTLKPAKDLCVRFSFEGETQPPVVGEVTAMITEPPTTDGYRLQAKRWPEVAQDENGVILLKDAPDCEALYHFYVPTDGVSMLGGGRGYGATVAPNDDDQVAQVVSQRATDRREMRDNPNDFGQATPYGVIYYQASP